MTHTPAAVITILKNQPGENIARAIAHLERLQSQGCIGLSLGTFGPGGEPRSWDEWAKAFADLHDWLSKRTPEQVAADTRAGEDFLKLDQALCERDGALNILAELAPTTPGLAARIRKNFKGDALRYFENAMPLDPVQSAADPGPYHAVGLSEEEQYSKARALVIAEQKASTSFIQRHLQIGYNRAARILERLVAEKVCSEPNAVGKRYVLVKA